MLWWGTAHLHGLVGLQGRCLAAFGRGQCELHVGHGLLLSQQRRFYLHELRAQSAVLLRKPLLRLPHPGRARLLCPRDNVFDKVFDPSSTLNFDSTIAFLP